MKTSKAEPAAERSPLARVLQCCGPIAARRISDEDTDRAAALLKSLADPSRVRIVNLLANSRAPVCVCDLTTQIGLTQGTVSFHLKKLLEAGLVERRRRGTWAYYSLDREALRRVAAILDPEGVTR
ncbi:MAG: helix-turn-helix transcriptional regulator [Acidobacteria bacterium]|nr:helix-turn-helix transcriptional regulator [Acidobacteriota bacterium]